MAKKIPGSLLLTITGHSNRVHCIELVDNEGDGRSPRVFSGGADGTLLVHDFESGSFVQKLRTPPGEDQTDSVKCLLYVGNDTIWAGTSDGRICVLNTNNGKCHQVIQAHTAAVTALVLQSGGDGSVWSSSGDKTISRWNSQTGEKLNTLTRHTHWVRSLCIFGDLLWSGSDDGSIFIWNLMTGGFIQRLTGHEGSVLHLAEVGTEVWSGSADRRIRCWDGRSGRLVRVLHGHDARVNAIAYSPTYPGESKVVDTGTARGNTGVVWSGGADKILRMWDAGTGKELRALQGHQGGVWSLKSMGPYVWSGSGDSKIRIWAGPECRGLLPPREPSSFLTPGGSGAYSSHNRGGHASGEGGELDMTVEDLERSVAAHSKARSDVQKDKWKMGKELAQARKKLKSEEEMREQEEQSRRDLEYQLRTLRGMLGDMAADVLGEEEDEWRRRLQNADEDALQEELEYMKSRLRGMKRGDDSELEDELAALRDANADLQSRLYDSPSGHGRRHSGGGGGGRVMHDSDYLPEMHAGGRDGQGHPTARSPWHGGDGGGGGGPPLSSRGPPITGGAIPQQQPMMMSAPSPVPTPAPYPSAAGTAPAPSQNYAATAERAAAADARVTAADARSDQLRESLRASERRADHAESQVADLQRNVENATTEAATMRQERDAAQRHVEEEQNEVRKLKEQCRRKEEENRTLVADNRILTDENRTLSEDNRTMTGAHRTLTQEHETTKRILEEERGRLGLLQTALDRKAEEVTRITTTCEQAKQQMEEHKARADQLDATVEERTHQLTLLAQRAEVAEANVAAAEAANNDITQKSTALAQEIEGLRGRAERAEAECMEQAAAANGREVHMKGVHAQLREQAVALMQQSRDAQVELARVKEREIRGTEVERRKYEEVVGERDRLNAQMQEEGRLREAESARERTLRQEIERLTLKWNTARDMLVSSNAEKERTEQRAIEARRLLQEERRRRSMAEQKQKAVQSCVDRWHTTVMAGDGTGAGLGSGPGPRHPLLKLGTIGRAGDPLVVVTGGGGSGRSVSSAWDKVVMLERKSKELQKEEGKLHRQCEQFVHVLEGDKNMDPTGLLASTSSFPSRSHDDVRGVCTDSTMMDLTQLRAAFDLSLTSELKARGRDVSFG